MTLPFAISLFSSLLMNFLRDHLLGTMYDIFRHHPFCRMKIIMQKKKMKFFRLLKYMFFVVQIGVIRILGRCCVQICKWFGAFSIRLSAATARMQDGRQFCRNQVTLDSGGMFCTRLWHLSPCHNNIHANKQTFCCRNTLPRE